VVLWASAFVGIRAAGTELSPGALALGRLLVGSLLLGALVVARRVPLPRGRALALSVAAPDTSSVDPTGALDHLGQRSQTRGTREPRAPYADPES